MVERVVTNNKGQLYCSYHLENSKSFRRSVLGQGKDQVCIHYKSQYHNCSLIIKSKMATQSYSITGVYNFFFFYKVQVATF